MPKDEHNAPGFYYLVKWRRHDLVEQQEFFERIIAADQSSLTISDQPVYKPYELYVLAVNRMGEAVSPPKMVVSYSSEDGEIAVLTSTVWMWLKKALLRYQEELKVSC